VQDAAHCPAAEVLTPSAVFSKTGAATKKCTSEQASIEGHIPAMAQVLRNLPQVTRFYNLIRTSGVNSIPGYNITVLAPTDDAFGEAQASGLITDAQLKDPPTAKQILLRHIVPSQGIKSAMFDQVGGVLRDAANGTLVVSKNVSTGLVEVGKAPIVIPDVLATNGVIHILGGLVSEERTGVAASAPSHPETEGGVHGAAPTPTFGGLVVGPAVEVTGGVGGGGGAGASVASPLPKPNQLDLVPSLPPPNLSSLQPSLSPYPALTVPPAALVMSPPSSPPPRPLAIGQRVPADAAAPSSVGMNTLILQQQQQQQQQTRRGGGIDPSPFNACECSSTGVSGGVSTRRSGCAERIGEQFTYVYIIVIDHAIKRPCYISPTYPLPFEFAELSLSSFATQIQDAH